MIITSLTQQTLNRHAARALDILDRYWKDLSRDSDIPLWSMVDPGAFQDALDHAFLAERYGRCHARIRVAGGAVADMCGTDCDGLPLSLWIRQDYRAAFNDALQRCCEHRHAVALELVADIDICARMVLYPLRDTTGRVTQILGGLAPVSDASQKAGPFGLARITTHATPATKATLRLVVDNT